MTGYGKASVAIAGGSITIEIRTLNGKTADINIKTPLLPKDKELVIRHMLSKRLTRGTVDFYMNYDANAASAAKTINTAVVEEYFTRIREISERLGVKDNGASCLEAVLRFPDIFEGGRQEIIGDDNWSEVESAISAAIDAVCDYREREGAALYKDVTRRVAGILVMEDEVEALEPERIAAVRSRIEKALADMQVKTDPARFEEEMIYYLEKLDINEEKVRLRQHCKYFMDTIDGEDYPGKKLGFIIQEMGREINTTGSKANFAPIQQIVVRMKDELEKIREQSMNIL